MINKQTSTTQPEPDIPNAMERSIRRMNPWWSGDPFPQIPLTRRNLVGQIRNRLDRGLAAVVLVRGPRQVGKTTACYHIIQDLLEEGVEPRRIIRLQCDEIFPRGKKQDAFTRILEWYERTILEENVNAAARRKKKVFIFLDEVQVLRNWSVQVKVLVDHNTVHVVATGSSSLRLKSGQESMAGRVTTQECGVLTLSEIGILNGSTALKPFWIENGLKAWGEIDFWKELKSYGLSRKADRDTAFAAFSARGGYPLAHIHPDEPWEHIADQLNEIVIQRVLRLDFQNTRYDARLTEELLRIACRYAGDAPAMQTLAREASAAVEHNVTPREVAKYLQRIEDTLILRLIPALEIRLKKIPPRKKICLCDHALRAGWLQEVVPLDPALLGNNIHLATLAGRLAESVIGAMLSTVPGLDIAFLPAKKDEPEIDFIMTVGMKRIPLEVKYQRRIDFSRDSAGIRRFIDNNINNAPFGLIVSQTDSAHFDDPRIITIPLSTLMLLR